MNVRELIEALEDFASIYGDNLPVVFYDEYECVRVKVIMTDGNEIVLEEVFGAVDEEEYDLIYQEGGTWYGSGDTD